MCWCACFRHYSSASFRCSLSAMFRHNLLARLWHNLSASVRHDYLKGQINDSNDSRNLASCSNIGVLADFETSRCANFGFIPIALRVFRLDNFALHIRPCVLRLLELRTSGIVIVFEFTAKSDRSARLAWRSDDSCVLATTSYLGITSIA